MNTNYSLIFYLKKMKNYVNGPKPIYMRIIVAGVRKELSTGRECGPVRWNSRTNRAKGKKPYLNVYLDALKVRSKTCMYN